MSFLHFYPVLKELKNLFKTNVGVGQILSSPSLNVVTPRVSEKSPQGTRTTGHHNSLWCILSLPNYPHSRLTYSVVPDR